MQLETIAKELRRDVIDMLYEAKSGHPGGSLSCIDILTVLYYEIMDLKYDENGARIDKFILSKGHAAPALYSVLAKKGIISKDELKYLRKTKGSLEGHPSIKTPGVDVGTGSLGQGLSIANGMAIAKKIDNKEGYVYVLMGDGELEEGQVWEAMMTANKYKLGNLVMIVDYNGLQIDGSIKDVKALNNLAEKISSFGIEVIECNGHNLMELRLALSQARENSIATCIIAKTIKGKGVSFMENNVSWHGKSLSEEEYNRAVEELM